MRYASSNVQAAPSDLNFKDIERSAGIEWGRAHVPSPMQVSRSEVKFSR